MTRDADGEPFRLLPWVGQGGKRLYLSTDDPASRLARAADAAEAVQLQMAVQLIDHSEAMLTARPVTARELHHLAHCLTGSLRDVVRIAESRGGRPG